MSLVAASTITAGATAASPMLGLGAIPLNLILFGLGAYLLKKKKRHIAGPVIGGGAGLTAIDPSGSADTISVVLPAIMNLATTLM